jgi:hypothetical protein
MEPIKTSTSFLFIAIHCHDTTFVDGGGVCSTRIITLPLIAYSCNGKLLNNENPICPLEGGFVAPSVTNGNAKPDKTLIFRGKNESRYRELPQYALLFYLFFL